MNNKAELEAHAKFGVVGLGWQLNQAPAPGKLVQYELETAKALKVLRPDIKVFVSRNTKAAAYFWDSCRERMTNPIRLRTTLRSAVARTWCRILTASLPRILLTPGRRRHRTIAPVPQHRAPSGNRPAMTKSQATAPLRVGQLADPSEREGL